MDNPYHRSTHKPHHLDRAIARAICFDVFNIISASAALALEFELAEEGEDTRTSANFRLHHELAEMRLSQLLLQLAIFVRTFDDISRESEHATHYIDHADKTSGVDFIGTLNGTNDLSLREACNKIIHASDFRPIYENTFRETTHGQEEEAWHLTGEIELAGANGKKKWEAVLYVENFLEIALDRISYSPPTEAENSKIEL